MDKSIKSINQSIVEIPDLSLPNIILVANPPKIIEILLDIVFLV